MHTDTCKNIANLFCTIWMNCHRHFVSASLMLPRSKTTAKTLSNSCQLSQSPADVNSSSLDLFTFWYTNPTTPTHPCLLIYWNLFPPFFIDIYLFATIQYNFSFLFVYFFFWSDTAMENLFSPLVCTCL